MAYQIIAACVSCWACLPLCPNEAIAAARPHFRIDAQRCSGCAGVFDDPQCASICPVEGAILDDQGLPANPPGSLTGIPPERLTAAMAEIRAR